MNKILIIKGGDKLIKVDYHLNIEVSHGDSGCLYFGSNPYVFEGGEEITFDVFIGDDVKFSKKSSIVDRGLLFLELTKPEIESIPIGDFSYRVFAKYDNGSLSEYVINSKEFKVKEG
ncbi:hypothetical protein [Clostridium phage DCp1]|uniref:Uncharacterized protein n=1 Tax=Clostridium phage DCp1 TaxID=2981543 RepID=A0A977WM13_9CAUD|nr:hypothetical protein [Clostridium phage DCp1]